MDQGSALVMVVDPKTNRIESRKVTIEAISSNMAILSGGVATGELVVAHNASQLSVGAKVRYIKSGR
jgi:hypothetical protein